MDTIVPIRISNAIVKGIDSMVEKGLFRNRNEVIREGIRSIIGQYCTDNANRKVIASVIANYLVFTYKNLIQAIILFGSVAEGTDNEDSDIDLLVLTRIKLSYDQKFELTDKIVNLLQKLNYITSLQFQPYKEFLERVQANFEFESSVLHQGKILVGTISNSI